MGFNVLKRSGIVGVNAHGGAGEKSDEENRQIIYIWKPRFWGEISKNKIPSLCIYNVDLLSLFYAKLPNRVYVSKEKTKEISTAKQ